MCATGWDPRNESERKNDNGPLCAGLGGEQPMRSLDIRPGGVPTGLEGGGKNK